MMRDAVCCRGVEKRACGTDVYNMPIGQLHWNWTCIHDSAQRSGP